MSCSAIFELLYESLIAVGAWRVADEAVGPVIRTVQTFGFHLASLDIRQNSRLPRSGHGATAGGGRIRRAADYPDWDEDRRLDVLNRELASPRPFLRADMPGGAGGRRACCAPTGSWSSTCGVAAADGLGVLIVSMTRRLSDLLAPYLFAREVGLTTSTPDGLACRLPVVPLFETIDDLARSPDILRAFLQHPMTRAEPERAAPRTRRRSASCSR